MYNEIAVGAPVASALKRGLYGVVTKCDYVPFNSTYSVQWDMGGYSATTHDVTRDEIIECEWCEDSES